MELLFDNIATLIFVVGLYLADNTFSKPAGRYKGPRD